MLLFAVTACSGSDEPSKPTARAELSAGDYQQKLTELVEAVRPLTDQVNPAATVEQVNEVRGRLNTTLRERAVEFRNLKPPRAAVEAHRLLLEHFVATVELDTPIAATGNSACGVPFPAPLRVYQAKVATRQALDRAHLRDLPATFAEAGVRFTGFPVPPEPDKPVLEVRKPGNGEVLQRGPGGPGSIEVTNDSNRDAVVSAVTGDVAMPRTAVFVHSGAKANLAGLSGPYELYHKFGTDYDSQRRGFTRDCEFRKVKDPLDGRIRLKVAINETNTALGGIVKVAAF
ncbi:hypothetical protein AOZ06_29960 [Kibdelosporangium phytohabitans]|uniref:Uncharacterized protein n=1 Tax=Kibdelosporangium phytohabitans TaxID=860235 RepID=A0A0N9HYR6_9PSEU|nr:hypothetical protein AOZ06_29960 [Kibdelosporangium phytohabitans]